MEILINGQVEYLPKPVADPIDNDSIQVAGWYAHKNNLPVKSQFATTKENEIPLNFQSDLLMVLRREFRLYKKQKPYNSALVITPFANEPTIRLNLRQHMHVPPEVPIVLLDGQGNAPLLSKLLGRPVREWKASISLKETEIIQTVDGSYGISSLWDKKHNTPKSSFLRLWNQVLFPLIETHSDELVIITWKCVADYLRKQQEKGELPQALAIEHYGNTEGSNAYEERQIAVLLGTPQVNPADLAEMGNALFIAEESIDMERLEQFLPYNYVDCEGHGSIPFK